jgi:UPF0755 protein
MKRVFNIKKFLLFIFILFIICASSVVGVYFCLIGAPSNKSEQKIIYIEEGNSYSSIASLLKENNLIKSELAYKVYLKLNTPSEGLEFGQYALKTNYDVEELITILGKGSVSLAETVSVTFVEGKNMRYITKTIVDNFNISEEEISNKLKDSDYLDTLINDYWFLTDEIKNDKLYYSLEGYLYPDTYEFYKSADVDDIFRKMLDNMGNKIEEHKDVIELSEYTFHELLTIASSIELESGGDADRDGIAGVIYNRLKDNWSLGLDATTYYAEKIDDNIRDLYKSELNECNDYNTRSSCMAGKLPVGPVCNPGQKAIEAAIYPTEHEYYYYVSDRNGQTYFTRNESEHNKKCNELRNNGLWITY